MVKKKKIDNTTMGTIFFLKRNKTETIEVHIDNGRVNVNHVSAQVSVRNFTYIGLNINKINTVNVAQ